MFSKIKSILERYVIGQISHFSCVTDCLSAKRENISSATIGIPHCTDIYYPFALWGKTLNNFSGISLNLPPFGELCVLLAYMRESNHI